MNRTAWTVLSLVLLVVVIVGADVLFLRHLFWLRLASNVGLVLVFLLLYWRVLAKR